ncbi:MAG: SNARE associated Golgi protein, partial [Halodesulfovibrio sp.]
ISSVSFLGGSALGYVPQTFIFALLGSGVNVDPVWRTTISAVLMVVSSLLGYRLYRKYRVESELDA